jgi:predicted RNase H-like HicB family nuclease
MARYLAILDGKPGAFGVVIPDLPGCTSAGATADEALQNAVEAITLWIKDAHADGEELPVPRGARKLRKDRDIQAALIKGGILVCVL